MTDLLCTEGMKNNGRRLGERTARDRKGCKGSEVTGMVHVVMTGLGSRADGASDLGAGVGWRAALGADARDRSVRFTFFDALEARCYGQASSIRNLLNSFQASPLRHRAWRSNARTRQIPVV